MEAAALMCGGSFLLCSRVAVIEKGKITDIFNVNQKDYEKSNKSYADYVREVLK